MFKKMKKEVMVLLARENVGRCTAVAEIRGQRHLQSHCQSSLGVEMDVNEKMRTKGRILGKQGAKSLYTSLVHSPCEKAFRALASF